MSPTVWREKGYRFFFFSREEERMHIHVHCADGEAKFWLDPRIEVAKSYNLAPNRLKEVYEIIEDHQDDFRAAWKAHFET